MFVTFIAVGCVAALAAAFSLSNEVVAWCCVAISVCGLITLIVDGRRQRRRKAGEAVEGLNSDETSAMGRERRGIDNLTDHFAVSHSQITDDVR
ncbi:hypothetical protein B8W69_03725 [Mycobacterium vulneris]|uniref:Uncharacterized protein n=1 Tax=Mycolicibacterium vulneris TaxID=547163 RepID=A0A1X2LC56_9MYCO|nr:hypothetical protein [Mycolicibacterium vulneris]OSC31564.1 hypothetical protein B8W69_03725 [Mycolicibacterium vulneris]